jgi:hypothetical protein
MGDRTPRLFDLAALPLLPINARQAAYAALLETGNLAQVNAKIRNFFQRGFITNQDWLTMTLTAAGQSAMDSQ